MKAPLHRFLPPLAMVLTVVIWGGSFTATKAGVGEVPPVFFALCRFAVSTLALLLTHAVLRTPLVIPRSLWPLVVWIAFLGTSVYYVIENIGLVYTTASNGSLLIAISPLLTVAGAVLFLGERLTLRLALGAGLACAGVVALVGADLPHTGFGDALMGIVTLLSVIYGLMSKRLADQVAPLPALTATFGVGVLGIVPFALAEHWLVPAPLHLNATFWLSLAYLGLGSSCIACWLWMYALRYMTASKVSLYVYFMPAVTVVGSHVMLGERLDLSMAAAAAAIIVGVYAASSAPGKVAEPLAASHG